MTRSPVRHLRGEHALDHGGLDSKIAKFTVHTNAPATDADLILVVPFGGDINEGFRRAIAARDRAVNLVGHGVTVRSAWPRGLADHPALALTELGAYRTQPAYEASRPIRRALTSWTDRIFSGLPAGVSGSEAFYGSAAGRLLAHTMDFRGVAEAIASKHANREVEVEVVGGRWDDLAQHLRVNANPRSAVIRSAQRLIWIPCVAAAWTVGMAGTLKREVGAFRSSARTRAALSRVRSAPATRVGDVWVGLVPDLMRLNRHVIETVALPAMRAGRLRGVLFVDSLRDGVRSETDLSSQAAEGVWPGLGPLRDFEDLEIEQLVRAETPTQLAADLAHAARTSAACALRLAAAGPRIVESRNIHHDLFRQLWSAALLSTIDVARATAAAHATERAVARRSFAGTQITFVSCAAPSMATACAVLNRAGATTIDFFHGAGIEQVHGPVESPARIHGTWTKLDAAAFHSIGHDAVEAGMPRRVRALTGRSFKRVLILSNYVHRDDIKKFGYPFQQELLRIANLAPGGFELRWRAHPADDPLLVQETLRTVRGVELSRGRRLEEDVEWAGIIVSSMSTALIESLLADVPAFVHLPPHFDGLDVFGFVARERIFFRAEELWPKLLATTALLARGVDVLAPERDARNALFGGPDGTPSTFDFDLRAKVE